MMISADFQTQTIQATPDRHPIEFLTPLCEFPNPLSTAIETLEDSAIVPMEPLDPNPILAVGGEPAAIILSIAVIILAVAELIKVLVPVMVQQSDRSR